MDAGRSIRDLVEMTVTLVQGPLQVEGVVTAIGVRLGDVDEEEAQLRLRTPDGTDHTVFLMPSDWSRAVRLFPWHQFVPDGPIAVEWGTPGAVRPVVGTRRVRKSSLAA